MARSDISHRGVKRWTLAAIADGVTIVYSATAAHGNLNAGPDGKAVSFQAGNSIIRLAGDADAVAGKLLTVEPDGRCTIEQGCIDLPAGTAATVTRGNKVVGAAGPAVGGQTGGYIRDMAPAVAAEVNKGRGQIIDIADTTHVWVDLW